MLSQPAGQLRLECCHVTKPCVSETQTLLLSLVAWTCLVSRVWALDSRMDGTVGLLFLPHISFFTHHHLSFLLGIQGGRTIYVSLAENNSPCCYSPLHLQWGAAAWNQSSVVSVLLFKSKRTDSSYCCSCPSENSCDTDNKDLRRGR